MILRNMQGCGRIEILESFNDSDSLYARDFFQHDSRYSQLKIKSIKDH